MSVLILMYVHLLKYHLLASACGLNTLNTLGTVWRIRYSRSLTTLGWSLSFKEFPAPPPSNRYTSNK